MVVTKNLFTMELLFRISVRILIKLESMEKYEKIFARIPGSLS